MTQKVSGWNQTTLGRLGRFYGGLTGKTKLDFESGNATYIEFMQVMRGETIDSGGEGSVQLLMGESQNEVHQGDVLFNGSSETPEEVALASAVRAELKGPTYLNSFCFGFRPFDAGLVDSVFLARFFRSDRGRKLVSSLAQGATRYNISKNKLGQLEFALPYIDEQRAITAVIDAADTEIFAINQLIKKKRAVKQGLMQELLTGKTRLPGFVRPWHQSSLQKLSSRVAGGGTPSKTRPEFWDGDIKWATVKDLSNFDPKRTIDSISPLGLENSSSTLVPAGGLIVSVRMLVGKAVQFDIPVAINQDLKYLILRPEVDSSFIKWWFELYGQTLGKSAGGSTVAGISTSELLSVSVNIPVITEQKAIVGVLESATSEIQALENQLESAKNIKQGMMQELLSGRTRLVGESQ